MEGISGDLGGLGGKEAIEVDLEEGGRKWRFLRQEMRGKELG